VTRAGASAPLYLAFCSALAAAVLLSCCLASARACAESASERVSPGPPQAAGHAHLALTQTEYRLRVGEVAAQLQQAAKQGERGKRFAQQAVAQLPEKATVASPGQAPVSIDNRDLLRTLRQRVGQGREGILSAAGVLRSLQSVLEPPPGPLPPHPRETLSRVLSRSDFKPSRLSQLQAWMVRMIDRMLEMLARVFESIGNRFPSLRLGLSKRAQHAILTALLVICGLVTLYLVARVGLGAGVARRRPSGEVALEAEPLRAHDQWLVEADAALRAGDYRAAVRALHLAALMRLDETGYISFTASLTDGRIVRTLAARGRGQIADALAALSRLFAAIWYGLAPAGPEEYRRAREEWQRLEAMTAEGGAGYARAVP